CTATKVIDRYLFIGFFLVQAISKRSGCWFVDNTLYFKTGNLTSIFGSMALTVIKVSRNSNYCFGDWLTKECLGIGLELSKNHSADFFWAVLFVAHFDFYALTTFDYL